MLCIFFPFFPEWKTQVLLRFQQLSWNQYLHPQAQQLRVCRRGRRCRYRHSRQGYINMAAVKEHRTGSFCWKLFFGLPIDHKALEVEQHICVNVSRCLQSSYHHHLRVILHDTFSNDNSSSAFKGQDVSWSVSALLACVLSGATISQHTGKLDGP